LQALLLLLALTALLLLLALTAALLLLPLAARLLRLCLLLTASWTRWTLLRMKWRSSRSIRQHWQRQRCVCVCVAGGDQGGTVSKGVRAAEGWWWWQNQMCEGEGGAAATVCGRHQGEGQCGNSRQGARTSGTSGGAGGRQQRCSTPEGGVAARGGGVEGEETAGDSSQALQHNRVGGRVSRVQCRGDTVSQRELILLLLSLVFTAACVSSAGC